MPANSRWDLIQGLKGYCLPRILKSYSGFILLSHFVTIRRRRNFDVFHTSSLCQPYFSVVFFAHFLVLSLSRLIQAVCNRLFVRVLSEKSSNCLKSQTELRCPFQPFSINVWSSIRFSIGRSLQLVRVGRIEWTCDNRLNITLEPSSYGRLF
jgi:hypothetical protein